METKTLVLGHRGASAYAPENTFAAFDRAFELGADGIELDVTLTKDGVPVVIHDDTVDRTSNGYGRVRSLTLSQLQRLDAGSWFDRKFSGEKIPTLADVLANVPNDKVVNIELKTSALRPWPANATRLAFPEYTKISIQMLARMWEPPYLERAVVQVVRDTNAAERVLISSFNPIALARVRKMNANLRRGLLYFSELPFFLGRCWLRVLARPHALHPRHAMVSDIYLKWARVSGYQVNAWTVDEPQEARRLHALGVNAIFTNKPDVVRAAIG